MRGEEKGIGPDLIQICELSPNFVEHRSLPEKKKFSMNVVLLSEISRKLFILRIERQLPRFERAGEVHDAHVTAELTDRR